MDVADQSFRNRRKLRRGTCSCRECKRRKIRCDFSDDSPSICISCRRRGTECVPQLPNESSSGDIDDRYHNVEESIARVEHLLDQLVQSPNALVPLSQTFSERRPGSRSRTDRRGKRQLQGTVDGSLESSETSTTSPRSPRTRPHLLACEASGGRSLERSTRDWSGYNLRQQNMSLGPPSIFSLSRLVHSYLPPSSLSRQIMLRGRLRGLPNQLHRTPVEAFLKQAIGLDEPGYSEFLEPTARPIVLANKLVRLALCLQQMDRTSDQSSLHLDGPAEDIAERFLEAASGYVTSQDALVVSLDGLETLMLESHFHINSGDYKLAWCKVRRAMDIARLLDFSKPQPRRQEGQQDGARGKLPMQPLWFRLIYMDRFFSMMLSFPVADVDDIWAEFDHREAQVPFKKLEQTHACIMKRIAVRNERMYHSSKEDESVYDHFQETQEIDSDLKEAARIMPARWWTIPVFSGAMTEAESKECWIRLFMQIHQYNLLASLYSPYILPGTNNGGDIGGAGSDHTYSKLTVLSACRELIIRFPALTNSERIPSQSRGIHIKMLIATITMILAHIDGHRLGSGNVLEHQRPYDLSMVDDAIRHLEDLRSRRPDLVDETCLQILRSLVDLETEVAQGAGYILWSSEPASGEIKCTMKILEEGFELMVPTVGTVHIVREAPTELNNIATTFSIDLMEGLGPVT